MRLTFWPTTVLAFLMIIGMHAVFQGMTPWRWYNEYYAYLFPLLLCGYASVRAGDTITFGSRFISGLIQSSTLPVIFHDNRTSFREPWDVLNEWLLFVVCYAAVFSVTTHGMVLKRQLRRWRRERMGLCVKCAYNLTGLTEPRCPECGTEFDPSTVPRAVGADTEDS